MAERYDLVVIGAGPGGYVAAIRAAQLGMKVACIEKRATLGGVCLNIGCIPSKALLDSSELYHLAAHRFAKHGIKVGEVGLDLKAMHARKDTVVKELTDGVKFLFRKNNITTLFGNARVASPTSVVVKDNEGLETTLETAHILLATGSVPIQLPFLPFDGQTIVGSTEALAFDKVPDHLLVVGGGYIGLELGSVWHRLGAKVTVVEFLPRIVPLADLEVGALLSKALVKQGLEFQMETKVTGAKVANGRALVTAETKDGKALTYDCDKVLVSVGRRAYTEGLGLEAVGVAFDPKTGKVGTDSHFRTNVPTISAIGDLIDGPMLAHKAEDEGMACAELLAGQAGHVNYETIPSVIYTWPEMASVGLTEEQVKDRKLDYKVGKFPFIANGRAKAMDEVEGIVKVIADAGTDRVLGVHIIGPRASDMIAEAVTTMEFAGSAEDIARICHAHPTLSEAFREAALDVDSRAIHSAREPRPQDVDETRYVPDEMVEAFAITDPALIQELKARREATDHDRRDEMWEGIYVVSPEANIEHEDFAAELLIVFAAVRGEVGGAKIRTGGNISDRVEGWHKNYRVPDVAVYLSTNPARNCGTHMVGGPDLAVEILSKNDLARNKLDFYAKINTRELLILDRAPWALELYRWNNGQLVLVGISTPDKPETLASGILPLTFRLARGEDRPTIEISRLDGGQSWQI